MMLGLISALSGVGELQPSFVHGGGMNMMMMNSGNGNGTVPQDALADILHHILMNETSTPGAPPCTDEDIAGIRRVEVTPENCEELGQCYISQEPFEAGMQALQLNCGHNFIEENITKWLKMHNTCPVCRVGVHEKRKEVEEEEEGEGERGGEGEQGEGEKESATESVQEEGAPAAELVPPVSGEE
jgi:hypothetical protein